MKKNQTRKVVLLKETVRDLETQEFRDAIGGRTPEQWFTVSTSYYCLPD
jgi:hypothetical protein